jgi:hypothetical protein
MKKPRDELIREIIVNSESKNKIDCSGLLLYKGQPIEGSVYTQSGWPQKGHSVLAVLRIRDVYPGSRIRLFSIPDPGSELSPSRIPDPHQRI